MATSGHGAVYELTVVGRLGPVLRAALAPAVAATASSHLTLTWHGDEEADLVDVVQLLVSLGLEATAVSTIH
jgi:hypothetical protein